MPQTVPVDVASLTSEPAAYRSVPYGREPVRSAMPPIGSYPNIFRPIRQHPKPSRPVRQDPRTQAIPSVPWLASQAVPCSSIPTSSDTRHCVDSCSSVLHRSRSPHAASQHSRAPPHARGRWRSPSRPRPQQWRPPPPPPPPPPPGGPSLLDARPVGGQTRVGAAARRRPLLLGSPVRPRARRAGGAGREGRGGRSVPDAPADSRRAAPGRRAGPAEVV